MNTNNGLILFLQENLQRLFTKSPLFFKIWTYISLLLVLVTGIPELVNAISGVIVIPDLWNEHITLIVSWASRGILFMTLLTTQSKTVAQTVNGVALKETDAKSLPFTAKNETKIVNEQSVPTVNINTKN